MVLIGAHKMVKMISKEGDSDVNIDVSIVITSKLSKLKGNAVKILTVSNVFHSTKVIGNLNKSL